jgi:hypothetical protein
MCKRIAAVAARCATSAIARTARARSAVSATPTIGVTVIHRVIAITPNLNIADRTVEGTGSHRVGGIERVAGIGGCHSAIVCSRTTQSIGIGVAPGIAVIA